ncbi:MAG TPA: hypothetical protein VM141_09620 [Planctomycetota bacterium]|nr:hypothetical protein [Planctomycetota bacterium]
MSWYRSWQPYVPVHQRRANAAKQLPKKLGKGATPQPIAVPGNKIATTFWGSSWCEHLEQFSDYENRLPRGRTYVRNGSVVHLAITEGKISAYVAGSSLYATTIKIGTLPRAKWNNLKRRCTGRIASLLELVQGRLSSEVMAVVTDRDNGLFPLPGEISFTCSCPDWASMCKHVAAVLYGVGAKLDSEPELLFTLRGVRHAELISQASADAIVERAADNTDRLLDGDSLAGVFGIELGNDAPSAAPAPKRNARQSRKRAAATSTAETPRPAEVAPSGDSTDKEAAAARKEAGKRASDTAGKRTKKAAKAAVKTKKAATKAAAKKVQGSRSKVHKVQGSRSKVHKVQGDQGPRSKVQSPKSKGTKVQGPKSKV